MTKIKISEYIVQHLLNLGIKDVFGLPGDYNFDLIEAIERTDGIEWRGCTNELNAGYAADGYARVSGYGAIITTYGVGELSAMNAIAGCYAESVPVVKIVGVPKTDCIKQNTVLHHNFEIPNYYAFSDAYSNIVSTTAYLDMDEKSAKKEIDRVFSALINEKKPVYIAVPVDVCDLKIDNDINLDISSSDYDILNTLKKHLAEVISKAQKPVIVADVLAERFNSINETKKFVEHSGFPVTTFLMGKGLINFDCKNYLGIYSGQHFNKNVYEYVNSSDCVISIGVIYSDLNTFGFDINYNPSDFIQVFGNYTIVENTRYDNVLMKDVLNCLIDVVERKDIKLPENKSLMSVPDKNTDDLLTADYFFPRIQEFLKEDDIVFTETGIIQFGFAPLNLPKGVKVCNQVLWGSIGWATPAAFGAAMARRDRRVVLITGEGSHQLTATEVSSMLRYGVKPIIIVLNNNGYTIERVLCKNPMDDFNEISSWNYSKLPEVFNGESIAVQARTVGQFEDALNIVETEQKNKLCYIEVFTGNMDVPLIVKKMMSRNFTDCQV